MTEGERLELLLSFIRMLRDVGSWTGRTHIHKFVFFVQALLDVSSDYNFVLYQRGPYSFDLDADIRTLRSIRAVDILPNHPYGPTYFHTREPTQMRSIGPEATAQLNELAKILGPRNAADLELLATTLWAMEEGITADEDIVQRVLSLKPQFSKEEVEGAVKTVREIRGRFE